MNPPDASTGPIFPPAIAAGGPTVALLQDPHEAEAGREAPDVRPPGDTAAAGPIGFAAFVRNYGSDPQFRSWFASIGDLLGAMASNPGPAQLERLIVTGAHLKFLMRFLDPSGTYTRGDIANLDLITRSALRRRLVADGILESDTSRSE